MLDVIIYIIHVMRFLRLNCHLFFTVNRITLYLTSALRRGCWSATNTGQIFQFHNCYINTSNKRLHSNCNFHLVQIEHQSRPKQDTTR